MRLLKLPLIVVLLVMALGIGGILLPHGALGGVASRQANPSLEGTTLPKWPAPNFRLTDQFGRTVTMAQFRGRPVLLTFMQSQCTGLCPVVADTIRRSLAEMGKQANGVSVLAISADPEHDTEASARQFSRQHGLLHRWSYLMASRKRLSPLWAAYHLYVAPANAPEQIRQSHTSATYLIDAAGRQRVLFTGAPDPRVLIRDIRILLGVPVNGGLVQAVPAAQAGHPAPGFRLTTVSGKSVSLQALRGHVVLLNFWATWCTACRSEMPRLERWYRRLGGKRLVVLGIDVQEGKGTVASFARRYGVRYPLALDSTGAVSATYDVADMPTSVLIDPQGTVESVHLGILDPTYLTAHIAPLLSSLHQ